MQYDYFLSSSSFLLDNARCYRTDCIGFPVVSNSICVNQSSCNKVVSFCVCSVLDSRPSVAVQCDSTNTTRSQDWNGCRFFEAEVACQTSYSHPQDLSGNVLAFLLLLEFTAPSQLLMSKDKILCNFTAIGYSWTKTPAHLECKLNASSGAGAVGDYKTCHLWNVFTTTCPRTVILMNNNAD
jgi:hypothetical protein